MTPTAPSLAMAPVAAVLERAVNWFKGPSIGYWCLPQCVQRLWEYLKHVKHGGRTRFKIKDWELAEEITKYDGQPAKRAWVQKALRWAERLGLIRRFKEYGRQHGRVIEIVLNLAGPAPKAQKQKAEGKAKGSARIPNVGEVRPATEAEAAAALAAIQAAADAAAEQPVPSDEVMADVQAQWAEIRARAAANKIPSGRNRPRISEEEMERRRQAARARTGDWVLDQDGMRIPAESPRAPDTS